MELERVRLCFNGALLWGALYVYLVFVTAGYQDNRAAQIASVITAGLTYLDYALLLALPGSNRVHVLVFITSLSAGTIAGLMLLR